MSDRAVAIHDLEFAYSGNAYSLALESLEVAQGETVAITGASGCGKTTLLHLMAGILRPGAGTIEIAGFSMHTASDPVRRHFRLARLGLIFQEFELLDHLTVRENVQLPYLLDSRLDGGKDEAERIEHLAERTGLGHLLRRKPRRLSQGERQRVAICRALITEPELVLADEPTGNLDPKTTREILDLLFEIVSAQSRTLIVVTHDHGLLDRFDRTIEMTSIAAAGVSP